MKFLLLAVIVFTAMGEDVQLSRSAEKALSSYEEDRAEAREDYEEDLASARSSVIKTLTRELKTLTRRGNLEAAMAIKGKIEEIEGDAAEAMILGESPDSTPTSSGRLTLISQKYEVREAKLGGLAQRQYEISILPEWLEGAKFIYRDRDYNKWLYPDSVTLNQDCTAVVAVVTNYIDREVMSKARYDLMEKNGWRQLSERFETSVYANEKWIYTLFAKKVKAGAWSEKDPAMITEHGAASIMFFK